MRMKVAIVVAIASIVSVNVCSAGLSKDFSNATKVVSKVEFAVAFEIKQLIDEAGQHFVKNDFVESANKISVATEKMNLLLEDCENQLVLDMVASDHRRICKAIRMLGENGEQLSPVSELELAVSPILRSRVWNTSYKSTPQDAVEAVQDAVESVQEAVEEVVEEIQEPESITAPEPESTETHDGSHNSGHVVEGGHIIHQQGHMHSGQIIGGGHVIDSSMMHYSAPVISYGYSGYNNCCPQYQYNNCCPSGTNWNPVYPSTPMNSYPSTPVYPSDSIAPGPSIMPSAPGNSLVMPSAPVVPAPIAPAPGPIGPAPGPSGPIGPSGFDPGMGQAQFSVGGSGAMGGSGVGSPGRVRVLSGNLFQGRLFQGRLFQGRLFQGQCGILQRPCGNGMRLFARPSRCGW